MMFPGAFSARTGEQALIGRGYYEVYMNVGNSFGCPTALAHLSAFYNWVVARGLRTKAALVGLSRGGAYAYNWAAENPDKVSVIYGDAPVCNFASWPYHFGKGTSVKDFNTLLKDYGYTTADQAVNCPTQPIKEVAPIVQAHISLIHVVGDADTTVPYAENTALMEQQIHQSGGQITVIHKPGCNHHPHGLDDPTPMVNFIIHHDQ